MIGFFAAGLEYSTGCTSVVVGKPEPKFFQSALDEINREHGTDIRIGGLFGNLTSLACEIGSHLGMLFKRL